MKTGLFLKDFTKILCIAFFVFTAMLTGCSGNGRTTTVSGWVSADSGVSSAKINIYDTSGDLIYASNVPVTGEYGSFRIDVKNLPENFRIVSVGGSHAGEPFTAELSAEYRGFNADTDTVYINPVTTMVSSYMARHTGETLDTAATAVRNFLEIPAGFDIGKGIKAPQTYFNYYVFQGEASSNGGVNSYIDQLVAKIDGNTTHPFSGTGMLGGIMGDVAGGLAKGALSYVGGQLFGWGLSELGLGFPDKTAEALAEIKQQLEQMQQQMNQMQQQLNLMSQQLDALANQIQGVELRLSAEIKQSGWDVRVGQISALLINIANIKEDLAIFVTNPPTNMMVLNTQRADIMNRIETQLLNHEDDIHLQMVGIAGTTPMLKLWSQIVKNQHRFLSSADSAAVQAQFDYFDTAQLWLAELIIEYYHAKATSYDKNTADGLEMFNMYNKKAKAVIDRYNSHLAAQKALLLPFMPDGIYFDNQKKALVRTELYYGTIQELKGMAGKFGTPPHFMGEGYNYFQWQWVGNPAIQNGMFFKSGIDGPYDNAIKLGFMTTSLNRTWNIVISPNSSDSTQYDVMALGSGAVRTVNQSSTEKFWWALTSPATVVGPTGLLVVDLSTLYFW